MSRKIRYNGYSFASLLTPAQVLGANYYDDWDGADLGLTNGDPVPSWLSKGLNGATLLAGVGNEPTYESGVYSFPTVNGDGIGDFMDVASSTAMYKFLHSNQGYIWAIFEVVGANPNALYPIVSTGGVASANVGYGLFYDDRSVASRNNAILTIIQKGTLGTSYSLNTANNLYTPQEISIITNKIDIPNTVADRNVFEYNYTTTSIGNSGGGSPSTANSSGNFTIFKDPTNGSFFANVRLARLIIADTVPTSTQLADMQTYLQATYGTFPI